MSETLVKPDVGDAELITAVRGGDVSAYGTLFERHVEAARRLARQLTNTSDADDLVSDAFAKVLRVLQNGGGPDLAFRAYLLTAVRRLHVDKARAGSRLTTTDDLEKFDPGVPFRDTAVEGFENSAAAAAFASLPERWQLVLWHTEVEGQKPAEVGELLGMSANSVSALAYRAREGLRQAFLNSHIAEIEDADCRWTHDHLGPYVRNGVSKRDAHKVEEHLDGCRKCMAIYLELTEVNSNLSGILAPIILGAAASGYLASGAGAAKVGFLAAAAGRVRDGITSNVPLSAAVGVAAVSTVVGVSVAISLNQGGRVDNADNPTGPVASSSSTPGNTEPDGTDPTGPDGNDPARRTRAGDGPTDGSTPASATEPATEPAAAPADGANDAAPDGSTDPAGAGGSDGPGGTGDPGGTGGTGGNGGNGGTGGTNSAPSIERADADYGALAPGQLAAQINVVELAGIRDTDRDPLEVTSADVTGGGGRVALGRPVATRAALTGDESWITYYPRGYTGRVTIGYVISDGHTRVRGTIRLTVPNQRPNAVDDAGEEHATANGSVRVNVLGNDDDPDGPHSALRITAVSDVNGWTSQPDGDAVEFTYPASFAGTQDFTYTVVDGDDATAQATVRVTVINDDPVAVDDSDSVQVRPGAVATLGTYADPNGDKLELVLGTKPTRGTVALAGGVVTYSAFADATPGTETVGYTVRDTRGGLVASTVTVQVSGRPNLGPTAGADTGRAQATANGSVRVDVLDNDRDPDGPHSDLEVVEVSDVDGWTTTIDGAVIEFSYPADFAGVQEFTYTVADGEGATAEAIVKVTVDNDAPVSDDAVDRVEVGPGGTATLGTYADPNGDTLALTLDGELTRGTIALTDGQVTYTARRDAPPGTDVVRYTVRDTRGGQTPGSVTVTVTVNRPPTAVNDDAGDVTASKGGRVEVDVVANDTDLDGDELRIARVIGTHHGMVQVEETKRRTLVFTYADDFAGTEEISYVVTDGQYESTATLTVTVVNDAPVAKDDTHLAPVKIGGNATINVLGNDIDANGDALSLVQVGPGENGKVSIEGNRAVYTPNPDAAAGPDVFTYTVRDARGGEDTAQARVTVAEPDHDVSVTVIEGERDDRHARLTARIAGYPSQGTVRLDITGQAINAVVGEALPAVCEKVGGDTYQCVFTDLAGVHHDVPVEVRFRGQERQLRFEVFAVGFAEPDGSGANNGANWPAVS